MAKITFGELSYGTLRECPIYANGQLVGRIVGNAKIQKTRGENRGQVYRVDAYEPITESWTGYYWYTYTMARKAITAIESGRPINRNDLVPEGPTDIVEVEISEVRTHHQSVPAEQNHEQVEQNWQNELTNRLQQLDSTEILRENMGRTEQQVLRDWLFAKKSVAVCAICGKEYITSALVAAHKKKRSECSEDERRDINIVVPLCKFGCDFLYEERYIHVERGFVKKRAPLENQTECKYIDSIVGNSVDSQWLEGPEHEFWN